MLVKFGQTSIRFWFFFTYLITTVADHLYSNSLTAYCISRRPPCLALEQWKLWYYRTASIHLLTGETGINEHVNLIAPDRESQISLESVCRSRNIQKKTEKKSIMALISTTIPSIRSPTHQLSILLSWERASWLWWPV